MIARLHASPCHSWHKAALKRAGRAARPRVSKVRKPLSQGAATACLGPKWAGYVWFPIRTTLMVQVPRNFVIGLLGNTYGEQQDHFGTHSEASLWNTTILASVWNTELILVIKTMPTTQTWDLLTSALLWKGGAFQSEVGTKKRPPMKIIVVRKPSLFKMRTLTHLRTQEQYVTHLRTLIISHSCSSEVGWGGVITFMFLCTHRHGNLIIFLLAVQQTQALLFHDQLPVGWGGVGWGGTITFMFLYTHTGTATSPFFLLYCRHGHRSFMSSYRWGGVGWGGVGWGGVGQ